MQRLIYKRGKKRMDKKKGNLDVLGTDVRGVSRWELMNYMIRWLRSRTAL